jgi:dipeptidyl aminopeptidase/acylaminoacyl peptidase
MEAPKERQMTQIVTAGTQALTVRSAALALRGLRDLARESNWLVKKIFPGPGKGLRISSAGQVATVSPGPNHRGLRARVYDIEEGLGPTELKAEGARHFPAEETSEEPRAAFAWSPSGAALLMSWNQWGHQLHYFDLREKSRTHSFGRFDQTPAYLTWARDGKFVAASRAGGRSAGVSLWEGGKGEVPFSGSSTAELGFPSWIERQTYEAEFGEEGAFLGYGRLAFSPDRRALAAVAEFQGEWADDSIAILDVPAMREQLTHPAQGHITDLDWTPDGRQIVYCASGQAYKLDVETMEAEALPFGAEWCAFHPELPVCVCYSAWLKNSAKGRLFLADLRTLKVFDEHAAEGVADLRWNFEATKAYAVTRDGLAYVYEPAFL